MTQITNLHQKADDIIAKIIDIKNEAICLGEFVQMMESGKVLLIKNQYNTKPDWDDEKQSLFIESFLMGLPPMPFYLKIDWKLNGCYVPIKGYQRLNAIQRFFCPKENEEPLRLVGLKHFTDLNGNLYTELDKTEKRNLQERQIRYHLFRSLPPSIEEEIVNRLR